MLGIVVYTQAKHRLILIWLRNLYNKINTKVKLTIKPAALPDRDAWVKMTGFRH